MKIKRPRLALFILALLLSGLSVFSQTVPTDIEALKKSAPKVFIDCGWCDLEYIKTEITFVNYVRDRKEAEVHILVTTQTTGSGGTEYTLAFSGQNGFSGLDDTLKYFSKTTDTDDEIRQGLVKTMKMGLMTYVAKTPIAGRIAVSYAEEQGARTVADKWKSWVFSLSARGYFSGEQSYRNQSITGNFSANRVTPDIKIKLGLSANYNYSRYDYDGEIIDNDRESYSFSGLVVKSLDEHWSVGGFLNASSSTYSNIQLNVSPAPAIEYNVFPYSQSTRRQLRILYWAAFSMTRYRQETIYFKTRENLLTESLSVAVSVKEKWGSISASLTGSHYFHDFSKNYLNLNATIQFNILKGLDAFLYGGGARIHDQLALVKGDYTLEDVILRRKQLETSYSYYLMFGMSYTFGSIYTNVVNPRFGSTGSGGIIIID